MSESGDGRGKGPGEDEGADVGSVAEEAAKLFGALSEWARDHGADPGSGSPAWPPRPRPVDPRRQRAHRHGQRRVHLLPDLPHRARRAPDEPRGAHAPRRRLPPRCCRRRRDSWRQRSPTKVAPRPGRLLRAHRPRRRDLAGGGRMTPRCGIDVGGTKIAGGVVDEKRRRSWRSSGVESPATDATRSRTPSAVWWPSSAAAPDRDRGRRRGRLHRQVPRDRAVRAEPRLARRWTSRPSSRSGSGCRS